jgi:hypothetical protein
MKINVSAILEGKEVADQILNEVKEKHGIVVNDGTYTIKCIVQNKNNEPVEVGLDKVKFIFERK